MPVKKREPFEFEFQHCGEDYYFKDFYILKDGIVLCYCDLTGTEYHGNQPVTLLCCKVAINAYYSGRQVGKEEHQQEVAETFKNMLGL